MRMHFFSMRSIVKPEMTFLEALKVIEQAQNEVFEHSNLSSLEAIAVRHKAMGNETHDVYESMSFSYQPYMPVPCLDEKCVTQVEVSGITTMLQCRIFI